MGYQEGLYFIELVIIIEYEHLFTYEVLCCEVRAQFPTWKRNCQIRNELGNRALKSDLKSTIIAILNKRRFCQQKEGIFNTYDKAQDFKVFLLPFTSAMMQNIAKVSYINFRVTIACLSSLILIYIIFSFDFHGLDNVDGQ